MGFNISGIAINKNYKENLIDLFNEFKWKVEFVEEISFEQASKNWKGEEYCDVYFSENGTLLFLNMNKCIDEWISPNCDVLTFVVSETSMSFSLNYTHDKTLRRSIKEIDGMRLVDTGEKLHIEENNKDLTTLILNQVGFILGKSFWEIDLNEKARRFKFVSNRKVSEPKEIPITNLTNVPSAIIEEKKTDSPKELIVESKPKTESYFNQGTSLFKGESEEIKQFRKLILELTINQNSIIIHLTKEKSFQVVSTAFFENQTNSIKRYLNNFKGKHNNIDESPIVCFAISLSDSSDKMFITEQGNLYLCNINNIDTPEINIISSDYRTYLGGLDKINETFKDKKKLVIEIDPQ